MKKILYIPLDERPCNYDFPSLLSKGSDFELVVPPEKILGKKKRPADLSSLWEWIFKNLPDCKGAILSIDMLIYGGIVPSRIHNSSIEVCKERLYKLQNIKVNNPELKIFAFNLIMRCPKYSSSDEEPDYYENFGESIFRKKYLEHKILLGEASSDEEIEYTKTTVPQDILNDFENRRNINKSVNIEVLSLLKDEILDFLIIPQDDSAPYGYTSIDQQDIRTQVRKLGLQAKALMYPGADEVGCTLLARYINESKSQQPKFKLSFSSSKAPLLIPLYEDRALLESIKYQVLAAGGLITNSDQPDIHLFINAPGSNMLEASEQPTLSRGYNIERNLIEFVEQLKDSVKNKKCTTAVADVAYSNGGDIELFQLMKQNNLLLKIGGYAGWNTSSNSLGTAIAQSVIHKTYGSTKEHINFLVHRYIEDIGYCSVVRKEVTDNVLPGMGYNYFYVDGENGVAASFVKEKLELFSKKISDSILINECYLPWSRMFEVGLSIKVDLPCKTSGRY